jgi:hypothetical protein
VLLTLSAVLSVTAVFVAGYYFGNQIGRTEHIRRQLAKSRARRVVDLAQDTDAYEHP